MEFEGGRYHAFNKHKKHSVFCCKWYRKLRPIEKEPGYGLFKFENKPRILKETPLSDERGISFALRKAWKKLPTSLTDYYARKESENGSTEKVIERCGGRVKFKMINDRALMSKNGLISYEPHSKGLSIAMKNYPSVYNDWVQVEDPPRFTNKILVSFPTAGVSTMRRMLALNKLLETITGDDLANRVVWRLRTVSRRMA